MTTQDHERLMRIWRQRLSQEITAAIVASIEHEYRLAWADRGISEDRIRRRLANRMGGWRDGVFASLIGMSPDELEQAAIRADVKPPRRPRHLHVVRG